jgi:hypothetical protein
MTRSEMTRSDNSKLLTLGINYRGKMFYSALPQTKTTSSRATGTDHSKVAGLSPPALVNRCFLKAFTQTDR